eukprot:scaffold47_cov258-Pinguiococcus_pyrenoidosus.AAC.107
MPPCHDATMPLAPRRMILRRLRSKRQHRILREAAPAPAPRASGILRRRFPRTMLGADTVKLGLLVACVAASWGNPAAAFAPPNLKAGRPATQLHATESWSRRDFALANICAVGALALPTVPAVAAEVEDLGPPSLSEEEQMRIQRKLEAQRAASSKGAKKATYSESLKKEQEKKAERSARTKEQKQQDLCEVRVPADEMVGNHAHHPQRRPTPTPRRTPTPRPTPTPTYASSKQC